MLNMCDQNAVSVSDIGSAMKMYFFIPNDIMPSLSMSHLGRAKILASTLAFLPGSVAGFDAILPLLEAPGFGARWRG